MTDQVNMGNKGPVILMFSRTWILFFHKIMNYIFNFIIYIHSLKLLTLRIISINYQECVKKKAVDSMLAARNITKEAAVASVDKVFHRCYNDLSPVGRRIRRNSSDMQRAYRDRYLYGFYDD